MKWNAQEHQKCQILKCIVRIGTGYSMEDPVRKDIAKLKQYDVNDDEITMLQPSFSMFTVHNKLLPFLSFGGTSPPVFSRSQLPAQVNLIQPVLPVL